MRVGGSYSSRLDKKESGISMVLLYYADEIAALDPDQYGQFSRQLDICGINPTPNKNSASVGLVDKVYRSFPQLKLADLDVHFMMCSRPDGAIGPFGPGCGTG